MPVIYDSRPQVQRWRDEETGRFAKEPEEKFLTWFAEVQYRLADRKKAGVSYNIIGISFRTSEEDEEPRDEDILVIAQARIGANYVAFGVKSLTLVE